MEIGIEEVRHMAALSRLAVTEEEERLFAGQFAAIVEYMNVLQDIDVNGVEPLYSPVDQESVTRPDTAFHARTREELLQNAPESDEQYFTVPRIV
ncbi:MAG: Asp-tRNA(Asn)/Glu-tRNA(Gln) amidotransferase subunit GatC [Desulfovibrio sp.]|nr:Asp-tRNA(Asn)/Glu-tRNA(Gln) amidotransferase subunit GatC [Desulfovibrio sp.]